MCILGCTKLPIPHADVRLRCPQYVCVYVLVPYYSVCLCRFHFTTGKFPFEGDNVYKLFGAISTGKFEVPGDLSPLLQELIRGMLRKDAKDRFSIQQIREHS